MFCSVCYIDDEETCKSKISSFFVEHQKQWSPEVGAVIENVEILTKHKDKKSQEILHTVLKRT